MQWLLNGFLAERSNKSRKEKIRNLEIREIMNAQHNITRVDDWHALGISKGREVTELEWNAKGRRKKKGSLGKSGLIDWVKKRHHQQIPHREDTDDRELWRSKISLGQRIPTVLNKMVCVYIYDEIFFYIGLVFNMLSFSLEMLNISLLHVLYLKEYFIIIVLITIYLEPQV